MNKNIEFNDEIESIEYIGEDYCIDIEVSDDHLFYANDILTKNCISIANDSDFIGILGHDPDKLNYESEIHYKIVKNRLGGRTGTIGKLYMDSRSLKLYDDPEFDQWVEDSKRSGDERKPAEKEG